MIQTEQSDIAYDKPMIWVNLVMASMNDPHPMKGMFNSAIATQQMYGEWLITEDDEGVRVDALACQAGEGVFHIQNSDKTGHVGVLPRVSQWAPTLQMAVDVLNGQCNIMNARTGLSEEVIKDAIHKATCNLVFGR
jgi:hypothetical protein